MTTAVKLVCPECRRENEPERIYCHDCGTRLDRSGLTKAGPKEEDPAETQRRLRAMLDPQRAKLRLRFFQGSKLILSALLAAALIQMLRSPDLPEANNSGGMMPASINLDLENAAMDARVAQVRYSNEQVNAYLTYALKGKQAALSSYLKFERLFVGFEEGYTYFTVERSFSGLSLFTSASYSATLQGGNIVAKNRGGSIGRMPIHPALMRFADVLFSDVRGALERERKSIVKLGSMELHPQMIVFASKRAPQT